MEGNSYGYKRLQRLMKKFLKQKGQARAKAIAEYKKKLEHIKEDHVELLKKLSHNYRWINRELKADFKENKISAAEELKKKARNRKIFQKLLKNAKR